MNNDLREQVAKIIEPTSYMRSSDTNLEADRLITLIRTATLDEVKEAVNETFETREQHPDENYADGFYWSIKAIDSLRGK